MTNLEYLAAKAKGIPRYVFVKKHILTAHSDWQKNRSGDFSEIVDSSKLFEFVELLNDPMEKNWVYTFDSAQDIIETLRTQLAYLFMDALTIRAKVYAQWFIRGVVAGLIRRCIKLGSGEAIRWEYRLFSQVLCDEISRVAKIKKGPQLRSCTRQISETW